MGFGSLFLGYFLFLNVTYHGITDLIAALVMLFGLDKLRKINKPFLYCYRVTLGFSGLAFIELVTELMKMFDLLGGLTLLFSITSIVRSALAFTVTYFMLRGMEEVSREVDLPAIANKCKDRVPTVIVIYSMWVVLEVLGLFGSIPPSIPAMVSIITLLATIAVVIMNLSLIHKCYMLICMPEDLLPKEPKPSRFGFVNKFHQHEEQKRREYEEYKLEKFKKKMEKLKGKAKKNEKK